ncbi:MAG: glycosyltransferase family 39 protein [Candidatus Harrisonbacteria bacterium]|nr:glycosyltransferase family 39 protein [Candidatus Harrisonbacteria bacterium]
MSRTTILLICILAVAFFVRIAGISYGLPMWLVSDEPPFIFGALKMMELRTLVPALHTAEFGRILYFPPYLSYLYLILFVPVLGLKFLLFSGTLRQFISVTTLDPSTLFLAGRMLSVMLGTATVWLAYKIGKNVLAPLEPRAGFAAEAPALYSAAFLALSFLHTNFSHWARHWVPATFFFALVMYILSRQDVLPRRRYLLAALFAGIGAGINYQAGLSALFIALWFLLYDRLSLKERWVYASALLFLALVAIAYALYPGGLVVHAENVVGGAKSIAGFFRGYGFYAKKLVETEPAFFVFIIAGFVYAFLRKRKFFWVASLFSFAYIAVFYLLFFHMDRYILMLYPLFALVAGTGMSDATAWLAARARFLAYGLGAVVFGTMAAGVLRFDTLLIKNDTRVQAADWIAANVPQDKKVVTFARLLRVPATPQAIAEQRGIDPKSLRSADAAAERLPAELLPQPRFHALNLFDIDPNFVAVLPEYMRKNGYAYFMYSHEFADGLGAVSLLEGLGENVAAFNGFADNTDDITNGFGGGLRKMFALKSNGPTMVIKSLIANR